MHDVYPANPTTCVPVFQHLVLYGAQRKLIPRRTIMGHDTTVRAILRWFHVRVGRVDIKHDPVSAGVASAVDAVPMQDGELI